MVTLLTGPNTYAISRALTAKRASFNGETELFDGAELDASRLPDLFQGVSLFSTERLIVIRGASDNKTLWTDLERWVETVPKETEIVLVESSPDKRTKTFKTLQKHATI